MVHSQLIPLMYGALFALIIFPLAICQNCPKECVCEQKLALTYIICDVDNINSINSIDLQPEVPIALTLRCKKSSLSPSSLKARMFQKFYRLRSIEFYNCSFDYIDKEVFTGLNYLEHLYVFNSVNFTLPQNFFNHIRNLKKFIIAGSDWHVLSFDNLCILNNITLLAFSMNPISNILENSTYCSGNQYSFSQLKQLFLSYNEIQILRTGFAKRFQSLQYLTFQRNKIEEIQNGSLVNLPKLVYLDISQNYLQTLPEDFCAGCPELWELVISDNPITEIPPSVSKLHNLRKFQAKNTLLSDISIVVELSLRHLSVYNSSLNTIRSPFCGNNSILEELYLGRNKIHEIPANTFEQCRSLEHLDLSANNIESLYDESFNGLDSVKVLLLSMNNISHIDEGTFCRLNALRTLNLSNNLLTEMPRFPVNLSIIELGGNKLRRIHTSGFSQFPFVEILNLEMNHIYGIENNAFQESASLLRINLQQNRLRSFEEFAFSGLIKLLLLNIAYNDIEDLHSALKPLLNLTELQAEHNLLSTLKRNTFPKSLRKINLSKNKIKTIEEGTFENLKDLEMVDLRWNEIVSLDSSSLKLDPNIVAVSHFSIFGNPLNCDCHLAWLKNNSVSKYPIFTDLAPSECLQHDIYYLQAAYFESTDEKQFVCGYKRNSLFKLPFSCYLNCQCCLTENCLCQHKCTENCLCTFRYDLTDFRVDCKNGNLTDGTGIPPNATLIDLGANDLGYLTNETFIRQTKAEILFLNHSKITGIGERTFITFNMLKVLHLEYNEIRMLDSNSLLGLRKLKELILNHNKIERILSGTFNVTPSLEVLDLSHNNLRKIDSETFNVDSLKTIVLFENPWSCTCEDVNILSTFLINRFSQIDSQNILCNTSEIPVIQYDISFCRNKTLNTIFQISTIRDTLFVYILSIGLPLTVFVLGAVTLLYVYRIEIQLWLFARFGWRIMSKKNRLDEEDKKYDAFVSYHNSQEEFVLTEMLPHLEGTNPAYTLCVHFRDFAVAVDIVDNINESIENSKRTILLLTDQFLTSEWCRYEFQAAHLEALSNKMNSLILVLLEDVNPDLVDGGLKLYMKTKTYLRYDDPRFWDKLRFALPEKKEKTELKRNIQCQPYSIS